MYWKRLMLIGTPVAVLALGGAALLAAAQPAPAAAPAAAVDHPAGMGHELMPKRLESVIEIDMNEFSFATPDGLRNPTFTIPVGTTVGIHLHNEGGVMHELMLGRKPVNVVEKDSAGTKTTVPDGYSANFFGEVETDVFFYYGDAKAEIGGARFDELEVEPGIKDIWLRMQFPPELAGEWELGCFAPGHYEAGMHATLIAQ